METTVTLRPPFEYSPWVFLVGIAIFAAFLALFIWSLSKIIGPRKKKVEKNKFNVSPIRRNIGYQYIVKEKYIANEANKRHIRPLRYSLTLSTKTFIFLVEVYDDNFGANKGIMRQM